MPTGDPPLSTGEPRFYRAGELDDASLLVGRFERLSADVRELIGSIKDTVVPSIAKLTEAVQDLRSDVAGAIVSINALAGRVDKLEEATLHTRIAELERWRERFNVPKALTPVTKRRVKRRKK